jgi:hypothetical protein
MPDRLQWLQDRLTHDHALIGGFIVAFLLARLDVVSMDRTGSGDVFRHRTHSASAGVLKAAARLRRMYSRMLVSGDKSSPMTQGTVLLVLRYLGKPH